MFDEDLGAFFKQMTVPVMIGGSTFRGHLDRPSGTDLDIEGNTPSVTVQTDDIPDGTKIGTALTAWLRHFRVKGLRPDGTGVTVIDLEETWTAKGVFLKVTGLLMVGSGYPSRPFNFLITTIGDVLMLPEVAGVEALITAGVVEQLDPMETAAIGTVFRVLIPLDFNGVSGNEPVCFYTAPVDSIVMFPAWENIERMVARGYIEAVV